MVLDPWLFAYVWCVTARRLKGIVQSANVLLGRWQVRAQPLRRDAAPVHHAALL